MKPVQPRKNTRSNPSFPAGVGLVHSPQTTACGNTTATNRQPKNQKEKTPELIFAERIRNQAGMARRDEILYQWKESHFDPILAADGERAAFDWLAKVFPDRATPPVAKGCFTAACMMARKMPDPAVSKVIIPLKNAYLHLNDDGTITRSNPDRQFGLTYSLNITLPGKTASYTPSSVPKGSMLERFLETSLPDPDVRDYVQELAGETLTPGVRYQKALLLKGKGRNGKSILIRLLQALHQQVAPMQLNALTGFALTPLIGASLAVVDEVPKSGINEQMLKTIISGEEISIDRKHRDPVRYRPTAKWIISTNNDQKTADNSDGFWRRLAIIPFTHQIPESEVIPCLDQKIIKDELQYFLDWCLIGLCRINARGQLPPEPQAVKIAKADAVEASNSVIAWVNDQEVRIGDTADALKDDVYKRYKEWCDHNRLRALSGGQFWKMLNDALPGMESVQRRIQPSGERKRFVNLVFGHPDETKESHPFA